MAHNITTIRRANEEFKRVRTYIETTQPDVRHSISSACRALGITYAGFMNRITRTQREVLWSLCKKWNADEYTPKVDPLPPAKVTIKPKHQETEKALDGIAEVIRTLDAAESAPVLSKTPVDPFGFPRIIYRMHKNFIGTWNCVKLTFFIRVEADVYFVVGYQYELSEFPGVFRADANLFDYNTDVNVALANLRRIIDEKVGPVLKDKILGLIQYGIEPVAPYDPRQIVGKTKVGAPDGEYTARVSGDLGRLEAGGKLYEFAIPENLPAGELPCKVQFNQVTLFV